MKRSFLKENTHINKLKLTDVPKEGKAVLPPIRVSIEEDEQKTLEGVVKRIKDYVKRFNGTAVEILRRCLEQLVKQPSDLILSSPPQCQPHTISIHKKTSKALLLPDSPQPEWGVRSQILSIKRDELRKVESRKLFEKMRSAKYEEMGWKNEKELAAAMRSRIVEKEEEIAGLNKKMEELRGKCFQIQKKEKEWKQKVILLEGKVEEMMGKKQKQFERVNQELQSQKDQIHTLTANIKVLKKSLGDRQQEITSLYQIYLSNPSLSLL